MRLKLKDNKNKRKVVFLYLDAFAFDYLKYAPFLSKLAKTGICGNVKTVAMHQPEFSIFSGVKQNKFDLFSWFYINPNKSPYKFLRYRFWKLFDFKLFRKIIDYYVNLKRFYFGKTNLKSIGNIPLEIASYVAFTSDKMFLDKNSIENGKFLTLFDEIRKKGLSFVLHEWPISFSNNKIKLNPFVRTNKEIVDFLLINKEKDFLFGHFVNLDHVVHENGFDCLEVREEVIDLDKQIKRLIEKLQSNGSEDVVVVVLSDHGMVNVKKTIDVEKVLKDEDCLTLYDSTMVRIWCDKIKINKIKKRLEMLSKFGKVYDKKNIDLLGIRYNRAYTGDLLFAANPGVLIFPNYFDDKIVKAMHGYGLKKKDKIKELDALIIINSFGKKKRLRNLKGEDVIKKIKKFVFNL